jgi:hypothetical protein
MAAGVLVFAPCHRQEEIGNSENFPQDLVDLVTRIQIQTRSYQVIIKNCQNEQQWDFVSHVRWFRYVQIEDAWENLSVEDQGVLTRYETEPVLGPTGKLSVMWIKDGSLPGSLATYEALQVDFRNIHRLVEVGQIDLLRATHEGLLKTLRREKQPASKVRRANDTALKQVHDAWAQSLVTQRGRSVQTSGSSSSASGGAAVLHLPCIRLSVNAYLQTAATMHNDIAAWPDFAVALCGVSSGPALAPVIPGFTDPNLTTVQALVILGAKIVTDAFWQSLCCSNPQILAGLIKKPRTGSRSKTTIVHVPSRASTGKSGTSRRMAWIIRGHVLRECTHRPKRMANLMDYGSLRYITSETSQRTRLGLSPKLTLPDELGEQTQIDADGEAVVVIVLNDVHQFHFAYQSLRCCVESFRKTQKDEVGLLLQSVNAEFRSDNISDAHPALRCFLGLSVSDAEDVHPAVREIFGERGSTRDKILRGAENRLGILFSEEQLSSIRAITKPCSFLGHTAGAGKTQTLLAIVDYVAENMPDMMQFIAAPSIVMAKDLFLAIQKIRPQSEHRSMIFLAVVATGPVIEDHGTNFLRAIADKIVIDDLPLIGVLDSIIDILVAAETRASRARLVTQKQAFALWIRWFLSQRQLIVDSTVYAAILSRQEEICKHLSIVVTTVSNLVKIQGERSPWASYLDNERMRIAYIDEVECTSFPQIASSLPRCDCAILSGDKMQSKGQASHDSFGSTGGLWRPQDHLFQEHSANKTVREIDLWDGQGCATWLTRPTSKVECFTQWTTYRYGPKVVNFLKYTFGGELGQNLRAATEAPNTDLHAIRLSGLKWTYEHGEAAHCAVLFKVVCLVVAQEMLRHAECGGGNRRVIIILATLWQPLRHLRAYLHRALPYCLDALCSTLTEAMWSRLCVDEWYETQMLDFRVAQDAHGPTAALAIPLIIGSSEKNPTWHGDMLAECWLFELLIRGSHRLLVIFEDLREHVILGPKFHPELRAMRMDLDVGTHVLGSSQSNTASTGRGLVRICKAWWHLQLYIPEACLKILHGESSDSELAEYFENFFALIPLIMNVRIDLALVSTQWSFEYTSWPDRVTAAPHHGSAMDFLGLSEDSPPN